MEKSDCPFSDPNVTLFTVNTSWSLSHRNSEGLGLWEGHGAYSEVRIKTQIQPAWL